MRFALSSILNPLTPPGLRGLVTLLPRSGATFDTVPTTYSPAARKTATVTLSVLSFFFLCSNVFPFLFQHLEGEPAPKAGVKAGIQTGSLNSFTTMGPPSEILSEITTSSTKKTLLRLPPSRTRLPPWRFRFRFFPARFNTRDPGFRSIQLINSLTSTE